MNSTVKIALMIFGALVIVLLGFMAYLGVFSSIKVTEKTTGPYFYVYKEFVGDYTKTGKVFDDVWLTLEKNKIAYHYGIGIYFDNPENTPAEKLRSHCGVSLDKGDIPRALAADKTLKAGEIKQATRAFVAFPIKNFFSYFIGPLKVYPALMEYAKANGYEEMVVGIEVYDNANKLSYYLMDLVKK